MKNMYVEVVDKKAGKIQVTCPSCGNQRGFRFLRKQSWRKYRCEFCGADIELERDKSRNWQIKETE